MEKAISTVIFDFGGVLGLPLDPARAAAMASLCRLSPDQFRMLYQRDRLEFDRGTLGADQYWSRIFAAAGVSPSAEDLARIEHEDSLGWTRINRAVVAWAAELRAGGYATAILSNMPTGKLEFMRRDASFAWIRDFASAVFSCEYLMVKPEPQFYHLCLRQLGKNPSECLFLDDSPVNVAAAEKEGIASLLFHSAAEAAPRISGQWGLPVKSLLNGAG